MDNSLLASIQKGTRLKKAKSNDRSAPQVVGGAVGESNGSSSGQRNGSQTRGSDAEPPKMGGPLFSGGMPKLRSVGNKSTSSEGPKRSEAAAQPSRPSPAPVDRPAPPQVHTATRATAPPTAPPMARKAPAPPATIIKKPTPSPSNISNGIRKMSIDEPTPQVPFSVNNLRKTPNSSKLTEQNGFGSRREEYEAPAVQSKPKRPISVPSSTGLKSVNGRWKFPVEDDELPTPPEHEGIKKVYPSGRSIGTTVEPEPFVIKRPSAPSVRPPAPPMPMKKSVTPPVAQRMASEGTSSLNLIDEKISSLSSELKAAVSREEFECCIDLRGRIKKLKALKDDAESGFDISPAEINAV